MTETILETRNHTDCVVWNVEHNGLKMRVEQKKNKGGNLLERIYVYTCGDGYEYYDTTSFAIFNQMYLFEKLIGVKLELKEWP